MDLLKEAEKYEAKAQDYYNAYQYDGLSRQYTAYRRNKEMADALRAAANAQYTEESLRKLKLWVLDIPTHDDREFRRQFINMRDWVANGMK